MSNKGRRKFPNIKNNCTNFRIFYVKHIIYTYFRIFLVKLIVYYFFQEHFKDVATLRKYYKLQIQGQVSTVLGGAGEEGTSDIINDSGGVATSIILTKFQPSNRVELFSKAKNPRNLIFCILFEIPKRRLYKIIGPFRWKLFEKLIKD